ncbi:MAG: TetR/AcrR family transcriptional regulator [Chloroflexota bacterium]
MEDKPYHHGNLREALLKEAADQVASEGAGSLNLSKLARAVGVSQPAAYRHFANKQDLAISLGIYGYNLMRAEIETALVQVEKDAPTIKMMEVHAEAYVSFVLENPELAKLMFSLKERVKHPELYAASKSIATLIYQIIHAEHAKGRLQNGDVDNTVRVIWSAVHGLAILLIDEQLPRVTADKSQIPPLIRETVRVLVNGLFDFDV